MFWGLIMEPNKRYTQTVDKSFHVSMASLDVTTADDRMVQVMLCYEDRTYLLCSLKGGSTMQVPLDLNFQEGTKIGFTCNGQGHVHLTGYLIPDDDLDDVEEEEEEEDEDEEEEELTDKQLKRKALNTLKKKEKVKRTKYDAQADESSDDNADAVLNGLNDSDLSEGSDKEGEEDEDESEEDDDEDEEDEEEEEVEEEKPQSRKDKKNKQQQKKKEDNKKSVNEKEAKAQLQQQKTKEEKNKLGYEKETKQEQQHQQKKKKGEQQQNAQNAQGEQKKRVIEGGVQVEDLKVGNGAPAKPGKFVSVYYVGRLKNGKKFDATTQGDGFKFRLGKGEVIKGWDAGIVGMKIGGKRRITIPPAMAYGAKGSPPVIPGNSVLIFEVELKNVH